MKHRLTGLAILVVACGIASRPAMPAAVRDDLQAAEASIRAADADWAAAARTASVDAWMRFYAGDAIVLAPNVRMASDRETIRRAVGELLALPRLSIAWHPLKVEVAGSGDLAYVIGAYDLSYDGREGRESDQGKLLEVWRKQPDGRWKCIVDTWNSDGPAGAAQAPAREPAVPRSPAPVPAAPLSDDTPRASAPGAASEYGEIPTRYEETVRQYFQQNLKDPDSVRYRQITPPEKGTAATVTGTFFSRETRLPGWTVTATIDAKNTHGEYVGYKTYAFLFRGEKIVHTRSPLPSDEMK